LNTGTKSDGAVVGVILVDHGSKVQEANDMLLEVAALFERVSGYTVVEPAHMELTEPTIRQAFDACVARGATIVVVHPYFLSPGRHSTQDIPKMVEEAASGHTGIRFHVTAPLGVDEKIVRLSMERISSCLDAGVEGGVRRSGGNGYSSSEAAPVSEYTSSRS